MGGCHPSMAPETLPALLGRTARRHPHRTALAGLRDDGVRWSLSWGGLRERVRSAAARLRAAGAEPGDVVVVWNDPGPHRILGSLAVHELGAAELPLAPDLPSPQAHRILGNAAPEVGMVGPEAVRRRQVLADAGLEAWLAPGDLPDPAGARSPPPPTDPLPDREPDEETLLLPQGWRDETEVLPVQARELAAAARSAAEALPLDPSERVLQAATPTHVPARLAGTLAPLVVGASVAVPAGWPGNPGRDAGAHLRDAARWLGATSVVCGTGGVADLWRAMGQGAGPLETILAAGDPPPEAAVRDLEGAGVDVVAVDGPATTGPLTAVGRAGGDGLAPAPGLEVAVRGDELAVRGPGVPDEGADGDGWMGTGWWGEVDADRAVHPRGRVDDALEVDGETVAAEDLEAAVRGEAPVVARVVAFEEEEGEVCAVVVPDPAESEGDDPDGKRTRDRVAYAAGSAEPGPEKVAVRRRAPGAAEGLRDVAGEVRRSACKVAWQGELKWRDLS